MDNKELVILAAEKGSGTAEVTPASIVTATGQMTAEQAAQTRENLNAAPAATAITVSGSAVTITPEDNHIYKCGELASLAISFEPGPAPAGIKGALRAAGPDGEGLAYSIVFTSGSTPTVTTFPATILGLEDFAAEANTLYEINVLDNRAVVGSWAVSV